MTDNRLEDQVRDLAFKLWSTAGNQYGYAVDYWIMAERMVLEATSASARLTRSMVDTARAAARASAETPPLSLNTMCLQRTRELAQAMMQATGAHYSSTLEFWLAAEKHMLALLETSARAAGSTVGAEKAVANFFQGFSADEYLDQVRKAAYHLWEAAGRPYGDPLPFWVRAEEEVLSAGQAAKAEAEAPPAAAAATPEPAPVTRAPTSPAEAAAAAAPAVTIPADSGPARSAWARGTDAGNRAEKPDWQEPVAATAEPQHDKVAADGAKAPAAGAATSAAAPTPKRASGPAPEAVRKPAAQGVSKPTPKAGATKAATRVSSATTSAKAGSAKPAAKKTSAAASPSTQRPPAAKSTPSRTEARKPTAPKTKR